MILLYMGFSFVEVPIDVPGESWPVFPANSAIFCAARGGPWRDPVHPDRVIHLVAL